MDIPSTQNWKAMKTMSGKGFSVGVLTRLNICTFSLGIVQSTMIVRRLLSHSPLSTHVAAGQLREIKHLRPSTTVEWVRPNPSICTTVCPLVSMAWTFPRLPCSLLVTVLEIIDVAGRTCARRFNTTKSGPSFSSSLSGDVVGRGTLDLVRGVAVDKNELEMESVTLVGVTVGIEEEVEVVGRVEDGTGLEVEEYSWMTDDGGGADSTDLVGFPFGFPFQTN